MRKTQIPALLMSMVMLFASIASAAYAEEAVLPELTPSEQSALALLDSLDIADTSANAFVSRAQFVKNAARLVKMQSLGYQGAFSFTDVAPESDIYAILGNFATLGIISPAAEFFPERTISENEAVKIIVSALGYDDYAKSLGDYPAGYLTTANRIDLFTSFDIDSKLTVAEMTNLFASALEAKIRYVSLGRGEAHADVTVLEQYHKLTSFEGQITAIDRTGLTSVASAAYESHARIGSDLYDISLVPELRDYLGYRINAYVSLDSSDDKIYAYELATENVVTLSANDAELDLSAFKITVDEKNYSLSPDYQIIYNGVALEAAPGAEMNFEDGEIILIDSDDNRRYDVIQAWHTEYVVVDTFTYDGAAITDANKTGYGTSGIKLLCFNDDDVFYDFILPDGTTCSASDLAEMSVLAVNISYGEEYIRVKGVNSIVKGVITGVSGHSVEIGDTLYPMSAYAKKLTWTPSSSEVTLLLSESGEAIALTDEPSTMEYGYIMQIKKASGFDKDLIYMLTENGDKIYFTLKDNLTLDASPATAAAVLGDGTIHKYQFIRYKANAENEINCIDTESDRNGGADNLDPRDNLRIYHKEKNMRWYKDGNMIKTLYAPKTSSVFCIPAGLYDDPTGASYKFSEDDFYISSISSLDSFTYIDAAVYDVTEECDCGAIVRYSSDNPNTSLGLLGEYSGTGAVEKISTAVDSEGDYVRLVTLVNISGFQKLYFSKLLNDEFDKNSTKLNVGDVVRYTKIGNTLTNVRVEYDHSSGKPVIGLTSPDVYCAETPGTYGASSNLYWHDGTLYSFTNTHVIIKDDYDGGIRVVPYNSTLVIRYDKKLGGFKPIDLAAARTECSVGADLADKVVCLVRQSESTYFLALYEQ